MEKPSTLREIITDWASDQPTFRMSWGKAMMWIFLLSDAFIFGSFLAAYAGARLAATGPWPAAEKVFALHIGHTEVPLLLIAIMTFVLISSSGTMALAVTYGYQKNRTKTGLFLMLTVLLGLTFVGMQVFEWTKLIHEGFRPWENPMGAPQFGASFFMLTGFHGMHVTAGVIYLLIVAIKALRGVYDRLGDYQNVEIAGLYWHFVDLVWVFIFAFFYLL
ncbi:cytochrome c oxidase subunit 3 [Candidatus Acetothermia bacterium]|nr:cytochrome c oxidase subunit 3 [Candidatus Acetothermia bacterium]MCI2432524.1 cytochrome c oxidase subunit 3 [Candidatus Acetothermia bacterium]MCI2436581.1 cytochrome c oxidase subunit 3 [Candidatus Acetothermia bacterium]